MHLSLLALYEKRWQVVVKFLDGLLPHFKLVKQVWNHSKWLIDGKDADGDVGAAFTTAIQNPLFCSYLFMVHGLHTVLSKLEHWLESCSCHEHLSLNMSSTKQRKRRAALFGGGPFSDCPMCGKRAPELAAGRLAETLTELTGIALNLFSKELDCQLSEEGRALLFKDFSFAKSHLHFTLVAKFDFWQKIPWRLCGISHHWPSVGRSIACLAEFDESLAVPNMLTEHHHPQSLRFLSREGSLRDHVQAFADGAEMSESLRSAAFEHL